ncbi:hypothetical protein [Streptomyces regalis]|uniref:Uncharacterized protein n=1 Tax=Streptomyces regalis TaxID=68262 RepID=A0A0X3VQE4_9ACTN|nr:hypothetical protein [Streptomyces regalis]KUL46993.1 hypothetical protein ADL12_00685 [Streptomyces regalis]
MDGSLERQLLPALLGRPLLVQADAVDGHHVDGVVVLLADAEHFHRGVRAVGCGDAGPDALELARYGYGLLVLLQPCLVQLLLHVDDQSDLVGLRPAADPPLSDADPDDVEVGV